MHIINLNVDELSTLRSRVPIDVTTSLGVQIEIDPFDFGKDFVDRLEAGEAITGTTDDIRAGDEVALRINPPSRRELVYAEVLGRYLHSNPDGPPALTDDAKWVSVQAGEHDTFDISLHDTEESANSYDADALVGVDGFIWAPEVRVDLETGIVYNLSFEVSRGGPTGETMGPKPKVSA